MELSIKDELCSDESSDTLKALLMRVHVSCSATVILYESILVWKYFCVEVFLCGSIFVWKCFCVEVCKYVSM